MIVGTEIATAVAPYSELSHIATLVVVTCTCKERCQSMGGKCAAVNALVAVGCETCGETDVGSRILFVLHIIICAAEVATGVFEGGLTEDYIEMMLAEGLVVRQRVFNLPSEVFVHFGIYAGAVGVVVFGEPEFLCVAVKAPETHISADGRAEHEIVKECNVCKRATYDVVAPVVRAGQ